MSIYSKLSALLTAANTKTGESDTTLTDAVQTLIDGYGQGGGGDPDKWVRPAEWPDYSKLDLVKNSEEAMFFTYDNRYPPTKVGLYAEGNYNADIVTIGSDGTVSVLESTQKNSGQVFYKTLTSTDGDYVCIRITPQSDAHITAISMNSLAICRTVRSLERVLHIENGRLEILCQIPFSVWVL